MIYAPPEVDEARARAQCERRWWNRVSARRNPSNGLPRVDLVWMPLYLLTFRVHSATGPGVITASIEGWSGDFALFDARDALREGDPAGPSFPPRIAQEAAVAIGRRKLQETILKQRGQRGKPVVEAVQTVQRLQYPFWVYYYERRAGRLDIKVVDGVTGEVCGPKLKAGVLEAFRAQAAENATQERIST